MESKLLKESRVLAQRFLDFVNQAVSPFHVVHWCRTQLVQKGFKELVQTQSWKLEAPGKYFFTRNNSTIVAFNFGSQFNINNTGFKILGTHTDSPCLRLAPNSKASSADLHQTCVMTYGGGLWHTWFDRDLILAGKLIVKEGDTYKTKLWRASKPIFKVPNLAIHLTTEKKTFEPNTETHLRPIFSSEMYHKLLSSEEDTKEDQKEDKKEDKKTEKKVRHHAPLFQKIASESGINCEDIVDYDLYFADSNPAGFFGLDDEFISSARLDNLFSSFHAILALMENQNQGSFVNMAALFDHQECGSQSSQGAGSNIIFQSLTRIYKLLCQNAESSDNFEKTIQKSFIISADMAHAVHPNYSQKHQMNHKTEMNKGIVIKTNANQRYATDSVSAALLRIIAQKCQVPIQDFIVKNDSPCGSTIGPILSSKTGIKTIDIGAPMLGMHSIRETCGVIDGLHYQRLFQGFYTHFEGINHSLMSE